MSRTVYLLLLKSAHDRKEDKTSSHLEGGRPLALADR